MKELVLILLAVCINTALTSPEVEQKKAYFHHEQVETTMPFLLNENGVNTVDSVRNNYDISGALINQWIYYKDGSIDMFNTYMSINDIYLRVRYIEYLNKRPDLIVKIGAFSIAAKIRSLKNECKEEYLSIVLSSGTPEQCIKDYILFNYFLRSRNEEELSMKVFLREIKGIQDPKEEIISQEWEVVAITILIIAVMFLVIIAFDKLIKKRARGVEDTS